MNTEIWTCKDGTEIRVCDMGDRHLLNAHRLVCNHLVDCDEMNQFYFSPFAPTAEIASEMADEAMDECWKQEAVLRPWKDILGKEIKRRGLSPLTPKPKQSLPKVKSIEPIMSGDNCIGRIMELEK